MSARFMLDTDTVSFALRGEGRVIERLLHQRPADLCLSSITLAELNYGAEAKRSKKLRRLIDTFVENVASVPFDAQAASRFGPVAAGLARSGRPIGGFDTLIAAHALALGLTLVTNTTQHFSRVPGLRVENWA
jgi:tRNA(fMet)-specific endonuclease VapC